MSSLRKTPVLLSWGLWAILAAAILGTGLILGRDTGIEGQVREGLCRELLAGQTSGRQGLVSSVWWAPFPTLALLPAVFLLPAGQASLAGPLVAALFGAGAVVLLERMLRLWGAGRWRWLLTLGLGLHPAFLEHCWCGSSLPMVTALLLLLLYSLTSWIRERRLADLIWFAFGSACLLGSSYEMSGWILAGVVVLVAEEWRRPVSGQEKRAVLTVALLPLGYTAVLWLLMCWLIMGDPLYAIRSLRGPGPGPGGGLILPDPAWWSYAGLAAILLLILVSALRRHDRSGACLAVLGLTLPGAAGVLASRGLLWDTTPLLFAMWPALALGMGYTFSAGQRPGGLYAAGRWLAVAGVVLIAGLVPLLGPRAPGGHPGALSAGGASCRAPDYPWLPQLERHVRERSKYAKVFVCGFEGFALLKDLPGRVFEQALDFNFDKAKRDYYGHVLYLLVHRPEQRNAMDSIHWKYANIYVQGGKDTLYDSDWGEWRLFELVQASAPR